MRISPVYDRVLVAFQGPPAVGPAMVRQRRRLLDLLGSLDDAGWDTPSRCQDWTVQDVAAHLAGVDPYWAASIASGLAGTPTRILEGFDPKATPAAMVDAVRAKAPSDTFAELSSAAAALCDLVEGLDADGWSTLAESPPGHVSIDALVHHALWDAWIHERDVALPLGRTPVEEPDEVVASLRYAAALNPVFAVMHGMASPATLVVDVTDPSARIVVDVSDVVRVHDGAAPADAVVLHGGAAAMTEMLSARLPLDVDVPEDRRWLVTSIAEVFEVA